MEQQIKGYIIYNSERSECLVTDIEGYKYAWAYCPYCLKAASFYASKEEAQEKLDKLIKDTLEPIKLLESQKRYVEADVVRDTLKDLQACKIAEATQTITLHI